MGSSRAATSRPLCWLVLLTAIALSGCNQWIQPARLWKPRERTQAASRRAAPATLINQIESADPVSSETVASALPDRVDDRFTSEKDGSVIQAGHSAVSFSGGLSRSPAGSELESLDRKLNQILIEITGLEEQLVALSSLQQLALVTRTELSAIQRQLDRLSSQSTGVRPAAAVTESLAISRRDLQHSGRDELLFDPGRQPATTDAGQHPQSRAASPAQLTAINAKLNRILDQIADSRNTVVDTAANQYDARQVAAIEQKLNRILVTLGQVLAPARKPAEL